MSRTRSLIAATGATAAIIGTTIVGASGLASASPTPAVARVPGSAVAVHQPTRRDRRRRRGPAADRPGLAQAAGWPRRRASPTAVSTPGSPLVPPLPEPGALHGPVRGHRGRRPASWRWLRAAGLHRRSGRRAAQLRAGHRDGRSIDAAFRIQLENYRSSAAVNAGPYQLRANSHGRVHPRIAGRSVLGVTGLDNAAPRPPLQPGATAIGMAGPQRPGRASAHGALLALLRAAHSSRAAQAVRADLVPDRDLRLPAGPVRAAYGANMRNDRQGQTVALVELGLTPDMFLTLQDYARAERLPGALARSGTRSCRWARTRLRRPVRHRGAAGRRGLLRHGPRREPARGRRRQLQQRRLRPAGPVRRRHRDHRRHRTTTRWPTSAPTPGDRATTPSRRS